jgi:beta-phosphoglucomutase-like phosphatase (HAD superfamily)
VTAGAAGGGVIFNVDGTLLDTNYVHVAASWEAFRERGHDIRCADIDRAPADGRVRSCRAGAGPAGRFSYR